MKLPDQVRDTLDTIHEMAADLKYVQSVDDCDLNADGRRYYAALRQHLADLSKLQLKLAAIRCHPDMPRDKAEEGASDAK